MGSIVNGYFKIPKVMNTSNMPKKDCYFDKKFKIWVHVFTGAGRVCECGEMNCVQQTFNYLRNKNNKTLDREMAEKERLLNQDDAEESTAESDE